MAEPHDRKPILTIEQQIEHLKQKGVASSCVPRKRPRTTCATSATSSSSHPIANSSRNTREARATAAT